MWCSRIRCFESLLTESCLKKEPCHSLKSLYAHVTPHSACMIHDFKIECCKSHCACESVDRASRSASSVCLLIGLNWQAFLVPLSTALYIIMHTSLCESGCRRLLYHGRYRVYKYFLSTDRQILGLLLT